MTLPIPGGTLTLSAMPIGCPVLRVDVGGVRSSLRWRHGVWVVEAALGRSRTRRAGEWRAALDDVLGWLGAGDRAVVRAMLGVDR